MSDFTYRQDRYLQDGVPPLARNLLKPVRILGARYQFAPMGLELSCTGEPSALSGDLTITFMDAKGEIPYDCDASTLEILLNDLLEEKQIDGEAECTGGPLPGTPIGITMPKSRLLKVKFGLIAGGESLGSPDDLYCTILDEHGEPTVDVLNVSCLTPHYAYRVQCQAFKATVGAVDQWFISPEATLRSGAAQEVLDPAVPFSDTYGGAGEVDLFNSADRPRVSNAEALQILEDELVWAWPYNGAWYCRLKYPKTMLTVRATETIAAGATGAFQIQDRSGDSFPLVLSDTLHDPITGLAQTDFEEDDVGLATLVNGKWFEVARKFCPE